jgi:hypothetical protein
MGVYEGYRKYVFGSNAVACKGWKVDGVGGCGGRVVYGGASGGANNNNKKMIKDSNDNLFVTAGFEGKESTGDHRTRSKYQTQKIGGTPTNAEVVMAGGFINLNTNGTYVYGVDDYSINNCLYDYVRGEYDDSKIEGYRTNVNFNAGWNEYRDGYGKGSEYWGEIYVGSGEGTLGGLREKKRIKLGNKKGKRKRGNWTKRDGDGKDSDSDSDSNGSEEVDEWMSDNSVDEISVGSDDDDDDDDNGDNDDEMVMDATSTPPTGAVSTSTAATTTSSTTPAQPAVAAAVAVPAVAVPAVAVPPSAAPAAASATAAAVVERTNLAEAQMIDAGTKPSPPNLPANWVVVWSRSNKRWYFFDQKRNQSVWEYAKVS